ncbi:spore coat protein U domain-containing protein [Acidisoma silvae]|uniref:Spore coat protein U domain-containing protein n=1 Tax=Acidisoma silvae TaxID=2802396 RepID=A0A963YRE0_9PROT|nr:spore coat protein U domain-containing protein [Acidisoma silvae]MCB8875743.1 spore coat protein U domain-containing protein [Acidisoma silvae]
MRLLALAANTGLAALVLASSLLSLPQANAASSQGQLYVSMTILTSCTMTSEPLGFPSSAPSASTDGAGSIDITCTNGTPYALDLSAGSGQAATQVVTGVGTGQTVTVPVYDRISSERLPTAQTYGDTATVTIDY